MCHTKMIYQESNAFYFDVRGFVWDLIAEKGRAVKAELGMQSWVCVGLNWTKLGCEGRVRNAVLGLKEFLAALEREFRM